MRDNKVQLEGMLKDNEKQLAVVTHTQGRLLGNRRISLRLGMLLALTRTPSGCRKITGTCDEEQIVELLFHNLQRRAEETQSLSRGEFDEGVPSQ